MKAIVNRAGGRMGQAIVNLLLDNYEDMTLAAAVDKFPFDNEKYTVYENLNDFDGDADVIIDFSHFSATEALLDYAVQRNLPVVIATTGHTEKEKALIEEASKKIAIFLSANMSIGVALLVEMAKQTAKIMTGANIEIVEVHHNKKLDSPSGTALMIADGIKEALNNDAEIVCGRSGKSKRTDNEIGIHSLRMGNIVGEHEVIFTTDTQSITLKHEAYDRALFAQGAIKAAKFITTVPSGIYNMNDMIK